MPKIKINRSKLTISKKKADKWRNNDKKLRHETTQKEEKANKQKICLKICAKPLSGFIVK